MTGELSRRGALGAIVAAGGALGAPSGASARQATGGAYPRVTGDADMAALIPRISNWGRWGAGDRLGTLNHLTAARARAASMGVRSGRVVALGRVNSIGQVEAGAIALQRRPMASREQLTMTFHGFAMTHLDALCHAFASGEELYNGVPTTAVTQSGCTDLDVLPMSRGLTGRGVLLDVAEVRRRAGRVLRPGDAIGIVDLEIAERRQEVRVGPGDMLLVRTGLGRENTRERRCGLHPECVAYLRDRDVALLIGDGDSDVAPCPGFERYSGAMHGVAIPQLGMPLVDNADLEELASVCDTERRWSFLLVVAPLRLAGLTGSPVNPVAIL